MKRVLRAARESRGFTLIELIGVLAVTALMVSLLAPKIVGVMDDANLVAEVMSVKGVESATLNYFKQYGAFKGPDGSAITNWDHYAYEDWDRKVLLAGQFLETTMRSRLATNAYLRIVQVTTTSTTTDVLTSRGQVGHLPGFNVNNGYYNLTQQYSANTIRDDDGPAYALAAAPARARSAGWSAGWSVLPTSLSWRPPAMNLLGGRNRLAPLLLKGARRPHLDPAAAFSLVRKLVSGALGRSLGGGLGPLQCCYPLPAGTTPPPPGVGGYGDISGNPAHGNPGADNQIVAASANAPEYVVEVVLEGVSVYDAFRLSLAIDGPTQTNWAYFDSLGRVKYDMYNGSGGVKTGVVFVYLAHN